jgi:hypothetical protein
VSDFWAALGVLVPITSGLALLAYNKPRQYERLMNVLLMGLSIIFVAYMIFSLGYSSGASDAFAHVREKPDAFGFSYFPLFSNPFIPMGVVAFLMIALPGVLQITRWIKAADDEKPDAGEKNP